MDMGWKEGINMIIDCKTLSFNIKRNIKKEISEILIKGGRAPKLVVIMVGENQASKVYVKNKERACKEVGISNTTIKLPEDTSEDNLLGLIKQFNEDDGIDGILVQLPLPKHINEQKVINTIDPSKDVDGFHPDNIAKLFLGQKGLVPCTPKGIIKILDYLDCNLLEGKEVVIVGRSNIVGKPMALLCLQRNATVTMAHSKTKNLKEVCKRADVLIAAVGQAKMFNSDYIKPGAIVIDVGMNRDENNKLCGDVDYEDVKDIVSHITITPGGSGLMTIAMLIENTLEAYIRRNKDEKTI